MLKSKKLWAVALVSVLILELLSGIGCANAPASIPTTPFTFDYKLDESNIGFFISNDCIETLLAAPPFYTGEQPLPSQKTGAYDDAWVKKVAEIKREAESLTQAAVNVKPNLGDVRTAYLLYLATGLEAEPNLADFAKATFAQIETLLAQEIMAESEYNSITTDGVDNAYAKAFMDYLKVVKAVELGNLYLQDAGNLAAYAALAVSLLETDESAPIKEANTQLDEDMKVLEDMRGDLGAIASSIEKIDYGLKQLFTADYYFALAANDFINASLPDLEAKADSLTPREGLTEEDIQAIQAYLALFEKWQYQVKQQTDSLDKSKLIAVSLPTEPGAVYAAEPGGNYPTAVAALTTPLKSDEAGAEESSLFPGGWNAVKTAVKATVHGTQTGIGMAVDGIKILEDATIDLMALGLTASGRKNYDITLTDVWNGMQKDAAAVWENYNNRVSGVETLKTADAFFEVIEESVGEEAAAGAAKVVGENWISRGVGAVAGVTVGLFTSFAHGVYKWADRQATADELAEGTVDMAGALIGGSKVLVRGAMVPGLAKGVAVVASIEADSSLLAIWSATKRFEIKALTKGLKELALKNVTEEAKVDLENNIVQLRANKALEGHFRQLLTANDMEKKQLIDEALAAGKKNFSETANRSLNDLLKKDLAGLKAVLGENEGKLSAIEYMDNLIGKAVDDTVGKWAARNLVEWSSWLADNVAGWSSGSKPGTGAAAEQPGQASEEQPGQASEEQPGQASSPPSNSKQGNNIVLTLSTHATLKPHSWMNVTTNEITTATLNFSETKLFFSNDIGFKGPGEYQYTYSSAEDGASSDGGTHNDVFWGYAGITAGLLAEPSKLILLKLDISSGSIQFNDEWLPDSPYLEGPGAMVTLAIYDLFSDDDNYSGKLINRQLNPGETINFNGQYTTIPGQYGDYNLDYTGTITLK